jgi:sialidase-1
MPLVIRRSTDGGRTWGATRVVRSAPAPDGFSDPSLLVDRRTGRIFLFYAASVKEGFSGSGTGNSDTDPDILQTDLSYSDDDGATWHMGQLVGPGMNENKTVQLADGRLLLDVRATPDRLLANSDDGGITYTTPVANTQLPDPNDNGSVIRFAPNAPASSPQSHWLLESNNDSTTQRANLVVKMSCDDGATWPITKVVTSGSTGYSTLANLPGGRFGLLYEQNGYTEMTYASFDAQWLGASC